MNKVSKKNGMSKNEMSKMPNTKEVLDEEKLFKILEETKNPSPKKIQNILSRALKKKGLTLKEASCLLNTDDQKLIKKMFQASAKIKNEIYGERLVFFAPLYLSNFCVNNCDYCGFHKKNPAPRKKLSLEEVREQTKNLMALSSKDKSDIVAMASILEKEVKSSEDRRIVSGILWKRIKIGMALQVDATLDYERNKTSAELTAEDLKEDSPYNTYTRTGLPPSPINNPGLDAIKAALEPKASLYLYFLTDSDNNVHYAKDFEEHKRNKEKYLD